MRVLQDVSLTPKVDAQKRRAFVGAWTVWLWDIYAFDHFGALFGQGSRCDFDERTFGCAIKEDPGFGETKIEIFAMSWEMEDGIKGKRNT